MDISTPTSLSEFAAQADPFLARHEAEHGLMLGVAAATLKPEPHSYWALVIDRGAVVGAGLRTNTKLIVSREGGIGAMAALAADAASPYLHELLGPRYSVESFALAAGGDWTPVMEQGIYECRHVAYSPSVRGTRRVARPEDLRRVADFVQGLTSEAFGEVIGADEALVRADAHIARGTMHVWDVDGDVVSVAAAVAPTRHGIRINNVYTPPELRGRGYAGAVVASLTQAMLDAGREFTFLHTDMSNPISNRLYARIGYRHVGDLDVLRRGTAA